MNPLWILALLAVSKKNNNPGPPPAGNPGTPGNPVVDDYLDRM